MVAPFVLLGHGSAGGARLHVVRLEPLVVQSGLLGWVALDPPLLARHPFVRVLVARRTDARETSRTLVELLASVALVDLGAVRSGAILEFLRVRLDVRSKDGVDEDSEPLLGEIAMDDGH